MTTLVGLAYTSPAIATVVLDHSRFRVHLYRQSPSAMHSFLQEEDSRLPVVLVSSAAALRRIEDTEGVHAFLLSADPRVLFEIEGAVILDAKPHATNGGYTKIPVSPDNLNAALEVSGSFSFTPEADEALGTLAGGLSFHELVSSLLLSAEADLPAEYEENLCLYAVHAINRRSWVARVQKPGLKAGIPVEKMAEAEKYIDISPEADLLFRAFYDHVEKKVPIESVVSQYEVGTKDIKYLVSKVGKNELKYSKTPSDSPVTLKKRRKVRKLKPLDHKKTGSMEGKLKPRESALAVVLSALDDGGHQKLSRTVCAYIVGLLPKSALSSACKEAVSSGADKAVVKDALQFVKVLGSDSSLWRAYCAYTGYVGVTASVSAQKHSADSGDLRTILRYKPLPFVAQGMFVRWPEDMEPPASH